MPNPAGRQFDIDELNNLMRALEAQLASRVESLETQRTWGVPISEELVTDIGQRRRYIEELRQDISELLRAGPAPAPSPNESVFGRERSGGLRAASPDGLAIVIGHSPQGDRGAEGISPPFPAASTQGKSEYYWNKELAERMAAIARARGIRVEIFHRERNGSVGVREAYRQAKAWNPLAAVELHFNSADSASARGTETLYGRAGSIGWARVIQDQMVALYNRQGNQNRGLKDANLEGRGIVSLTNDVQPSALIEPFFGHQRDDAELGVTHKDALAAALVAAFAKHAGLPVDGGVTPVPLPPNPQPAPPIVGTLWDQLRTAATNEPIEFQQLKGIAFAQWALESGFGSSRLATQYINFAGMKWRPFMEGLATKVRYEAHDGVEYYCQFAGPAEFIKGYWARLDRHPAYDGWRRHTATGEGFFRFVADIWAPPRENPNYVSKVLSLHARLTNEGTLPKSSDTVPVEPSVDVPPDRSPSWSDEDFWLDTTEEEMRARARVLSPVAAAARARTLAQVKWAADPQSFDYAHLESSLPLGIDFTFTAFDLELLCQLNDFDVSVAGERPILFGLRGAAIAAGGSARDGAWHQEVVLKDQRPNHFETRCVMGVWNRATREIAVYPASTVPHAESVISWYETRASGNMLATGFYGYICGIHNGKPGCFLLRKTLDEKRRVIVRRSSNDLVYQSTDFVHNMAPGDNIHPAFSDEPGWFSSFGCQVVLGSATTSGSHSGPWSHFRKSAGLRDGNGEPGAAFHYVLLTGREALLASQLRRAGTAADPMASQDLRRLRLGSTGAAVKRLQMRLGVAGPDGKFGPDTAELLHTKQKLLSQGRSDGIYTPKLDAALGWDVLTPVPIA